MQIKNRILNALHFVHDAGIKFVKAEVLKSKCNCLKSRTCSSLRTCSLYVPFKLRADRTQAAKPTEPRDRIWSMSAVTRNECNCGESNKHCCSPNTPETGTTLRGECRARLPALHRIARMKSGLNHCGKLKNVARSAERK